MNSTDSKETNSLSKSENETSNELTKPFIYIIIFLMIFLSGNFIGTLSGPKTDNVEETTAVQETAQNVVITTQSTTQEQAQEQTTIQSEQAEVQTTVATTQAEDSQTQEQADDETQAGEETTDSFSVAEIAQLFNTAANNAKSNATQIVQEYKSIYIDPDKLTLPSAIQSICETAMTTFIKGESEPVSYTTSEEIIENFPVFDETWGAQVDASYLDSAICIDNGDTYSIELYFSDCENPSDGEYSASAFPTLSLSGMAEVPVIKNMIVEYTDCLITAEIDKQTGNLLNAVYVMPFYLRFDVSMGFSFSVAAGIEYEYSYTITY